MTVIEKNIVCEFVHDSTINYAIQQNHVPLIKRLLLTNKGPEEIGEILIRITSEPEFALPWEMTISSLRVDQRLDLGSVDIQLSPTFLGNLQERLQGVLVLTITNDGNVIYSTSSAISILAYDEWSGTQSLPEIIAAFVSPNHPEVLSILHDSSRFLQEWTGSPSLDAYQSKDPNRVKKQLSAIYYALQKQKIVYCVPPASFESQGQKVRTPDTIIQHKLGTCLDLTLLFAACAEAAGLHPLIIFINGHAFPGAWLVEETFADCLQDDITLLTKRIVPGVDEICVIESTAFTDGQNIPFENAVELAEKNLHDPDRFRFFVDVRRARISQIRPLPIRTTGAVMVEEKADTIMDPPTEIVQGYTSGSSDEITNKSLSRLEQWERRLLDLSLRNPLLNFRVTGSTIPLLSAKLSDLEDSLADGEDFQIFPRPTDWESSPRDASVYQKRMSRDPQIELLKAEFAQHRLRADLPEKDLANRLTQLYRSARTSIEENGANTLFMALGILVWYETDASEKPRYSPILLIPMELIRKSVQSGYKVRKGDDDPQLNITLLEMLRQDFGIIISGLDPLPTDEHGIDVKKIFSIIRRAVMNKSRWDVLEDAYLGLFTFNKFVMWYDLKARSEALKQNKVVASLIAGSLQWDPQYLGTAPEQLDSAYHPKDVACPISADSSQLSAIVAASNDRSFVLHGPPGTGKSQTITNMIAHALAQGKTVLFVAEKMAALSVVQRRLFQIGLAPFCLELHSNKSRKKDVLDQLKNSLEIATIESPRNWEREANRLAEVRDSLNKYVHALHRERSIGHSLFVGISRLAAVHSVPHHIVFKADQVKDINNEKFSEWKNLVHQLKIAGEACGHPYRHPWSLSRKTDYLPHLKTRTQELLTNLQEQITTWHTAIKPVSELLNLNEKINSYNDLLILMECSKLFVRVPTIPGTMVRSTDWDEVRSAVDNWIQHGRNRDTLRSDIYTRYTEQILQLDVASLREKYTMSQQKWFLPRLLGEYHIKKALQAVAKPGYTIEGKKLAKDLDMIQRLQDEEKVLAQSSDRARELLGRLWQDGNADWDSVATACQWTEEIRKLSNQISGTDINLARNLRDHWAQLVSDYRDQFKQGEKLGEQVRAFIKAGEEVKNTWGLIEDLLLIDSVALTNDPASPQWFSYIYDRIDQWLTHLDDLREWCTWYRIREEAIKCGLTVVVNPYEDGKILNEELESAFIKGFYQAWTEYEIAQDPSLSSFSRGLFEDKIKQFRDLDEKYSQLIKEEIYARLAAKIPRVSGNESHNSEIGILQREILKQRGHMALRTLFQKIPYVMKRLKPCLLMSPMSVAQYLDPAYPLFDLVIFDEASQVPTCDAVGAIARGKEVIVVGDPKQLPPTNFFTTMNNDDDSEFVEIQDLESILDDCLAIRMPEERLKWHYRSQHESLISFSNYQYYDNSLYTFPSPDDLTSVVRLYHVDGTYDRGKSRQNRIEGEAVVSEIVRRLTDPNLNKRSIGVVTFSVAQQRLIEDLLDEQRRQNPELESFFSTDEVEPVFVKNLENVQGDERDVIMFSVGYGPDANGQVSYNFGPLNKDGGWRRLNVAVSRARQEMLVFTSLRSDQLDLTRTGSKGVADLKAFLEYAERGKESLYAQLSVSGDAEPDSYFEELVCKALEERGYRVHLQVGCSGYRIDLAVVDPENPGRYLLGIECDGATYHRAKTARDRDKLREAVLRQLGWEIHRIWSIDWWENPKRELDRVEEAIRLAKVKASAPKKTKSIKPVKASIPIANNATTRHSKQQAQSSTKAEQYIGCVLPPVARPTNEFYSKDAIVSKQILTVVNSEGPVSHSVLCRRIAQAWGMTRVGNQIDNRIQQLCSKLKLNTTKHSNLVYYWPKNIKPSDYSIFRVPGDERRNIEDISPEEISNAIHEILSNQICLPEDDLIREVAKVFGFQRKSPAILKQFGLGIDILIKRGMAFREVDGKIVQAV